MSTEWISIRNQWPEKEGTYRVKDCRYNVVSKTYYDGYKFEKPTYSFSKKASFLFMEYMVTHWMPVKKSKGKDEK